ncbi:MAG: phosphoribosyltransferase family protein [Patescibacteria group bacterium]|jgi:orotate phosphoribosyltransferase
MNEQEVLQVLEGVGGVIVDSHIVYTAGNHGTKYVNKDAAYPHTYLTSKLCRAMAENFAEADVEVVVAPAIGGTILSQWTAFHLSEITDRDVLATYAERDETMVHKVEKVENGHVYTYELRLVRIDDKGKEVFWTTSHPQESDEVVIKHPRFVIKRGYDKLVKGRRVLVVEDVTTTGLSSKRVIEATRSVGGIVVGLGVLCNRGGVTPKDVADPPVLKALLNVKFDSWSEEECLRSGPCSKDVPINTAVGKGKDFLARHKKG